MPDSTTPAKAELRELDADFANEINRDKWVTVQFNPESLKVSFANQLATPSGAGDQGGTPRRQFVGAGTTKLSLQIWFDVTASQLPAADQNEVDVRKLTQKVAYFITPQPDPADANKFVPPAVRFLWGSFQFDGLMDSLEENLELFSPEGRPLRASMTLALSQQKIKAFTFANVQGRAGTGAGPAQPAAGTAPLSEAKSGDSVQSMATSAGKGDNWQAIASANGIENPRLLPPGQLLNLNVTTPSIRIGVE
jgi:hypothetical protein